MLKIVNQNGEWNIIIDNIEYNFYYSDAEPIQGLILNGCDTQMEKYQVGNNIITATKEQYLHNKQGYRYVLNIEQLES